MITKNELGYVSSWASRVPYPGISYAEKAGEKLKESFEDFNRFYAQKKYDIVLSNGEEFLFEILDKNLCHMLGIDYKNLTGEYFDFFRKNVLGLDYYEIPRSYDLLKIIIDNIDKVIEYDYNKQGSVLNYYRVMIKCSIFEKLSDFSRFNFGVINMNKEEYERNNYKGLSSNSSKFLYVQSNEAVAPYFMMGIKTADLPEGTVKEIDAPDEYITETLFAPQNHQTFFKNQEVAIPTQILTITDEKIDKVEATAAEKIALLNQYKTIIGLAGLSSRINIYSDYENMLSEENNKVLKRK